MPEESPSAPQSLSSLFKQLAAHAADLNTSSDELLKNVAALDAGIKQLNLGIVCWVPFREGKADERLQLSHEVGYAKVYGAWGICVRERVTRGPGASALAKEKDEIWLFKDAPRAMRLDAIEHLPALLERLIKKTRAAVTQTHATTALTKELAAATRKTIEERESPIPVTRKKTGDAK